MDTDDELNAAADRMAQNADAAANAAERARAEAETRVREDVAQLTAVAARVAQLAAERGVNCQQRRSDGLFRTKTEVIQPSRFLIGFGVGELESVFIDAEKGLILIKNADSKFEVTLSSVSYLAQHPETLTVIRQQLTQFMATHSLRL